MEKHLVKIVDIIPVTHDVRSYLVEKPAGYRFIPGQATEVSVNKERWENEKRPFTFTSLNDWNHLQFTIKSYPDHDGVTKQIGLLQPGDELYIRDVWGAIAYKGEGYFIAGGAGITPFIAILRQLHSDGAIGNNQLFFSNKTVDDIILHNELDQMLGTNAHYIVSAEEAAGYEHGRIDKAYLLNNINDFKKPFYICGPDKMIQDITEILKDLGADPDSVVFEK